ncbi:MAG: YqaA family protein [Pseudomonadota bacterium]|nr:YqaA family protein [Pseudomonadota bacterium]
MTLFSYLYKKALGWARHQHAVRYLSILSFAESSFFPIPPDIMLAPMAMARPSRAFYFALVATFASVLGGVFGYLIGQFAFDVIEPWLHQFHYWGKYLLARTWFDEWGFLAVLIAGFSPIPYKVFTIAAGTLSMPLAPFIFASFIGRGARFFLVSFLLAWGGERLEKMLNVYVNRIGWATVAMVGIGVLGYKFI